jgi:hypothetical protein
MLEKVVRPGGSKGAGWGGLASEVAGLVVHPPVPPPFPTPRLTTGERLRQGPAPQFLVELSHQHGQLPPRTRRKPGQNQFQKIPGHSHVLLKLTLVTGAARPTQVQVTARTGKESPVIT